MEIINTILNFFTDNTRRITTKAMTFVSLLLLIWIVDNTFSFTYYYNIDKKLEYVEKINKLAQDSSASKAEQSYLANQKNEIIYHSTVKERIWNFFENNKFEYFSLKRIKSDANQDGNIRNPLIHFITSSFLIIIIMIIIPFVAYSDKSLTFPKATLMVFLTEGVLYALAFIIANALGLIPVLFDKPYINYILNVVINLVFIILSYKVSKNIK